MELAMNEKQVVRKQLAAEYKRASSKKEKDPQLTDPIDRIQQCLRAGVA